MSFRNASYTTTPVIKVLNQTWSSSVHRKANQAASSVNLDDIKLFESGPRLRLKSQALGSNKINKTTASYLVSPRSLSASSVSSRSSPQQNYDTIDDEEFFVVTAPTTQMIPPDPIAAYLIKQNRIRHNFKKLNQIEKYLNKSRDFVKKNFDLIHTQIKASTNVKRSHQIHVVESQRELLSTTSAYKKHQPLTQSNSETYRDHFLTRHESFPVKDSHSTTTTTKLKSSERISSSSRKRERKKKHREQLDKDEATPEVRHRKSRRPSSNYELDEIQTKIANRTSLNSLAGEKIKEIDQNKRKSEFILQHQELRRNSNGISNRRSKNVFTSFDFLEFKKKATFDLLNSIENILNINSAISTTPPNNHNNNNYNNINNYIDHTNNGSLRNIINNSGKNFNLKRLEFSKSMIEFKLQLHSVIVKIEQVRLCNRNA